MTPQSNLRRSDWARGEWHEAARILHRANPDWSNAKIARALGVTQSAVWKVLHPERSSEFNRRDNARPERQAAKRAFDLEYDRRPDVRGTCRNPCCQNLRGIGHGPHSRKDRPGFCQSCADAVSEVRRTLAEGMWADGWKVREIGEAFGIDKDRMGITIATWRKRGHADAFPHRRTPEQVARISAGWARVRFQEAA